MKYTTKDSGKRDEFASGMRRDTTEGKARYDLVIPLNTPNHLLKRWAELMERGMAKYGYRNWEKANSEEEMNRFRASAFRHFVQWFEGDEEEDHAAAILFNVQGVEYVKERLDKKKGGIL